MNDIQNPSASTNEVVESESQELLEEVATNEQLHHFQNKEEVLNRVKEIASSDVDVPRQELESLKSGFYYFHKHDNEEAYKKFIEEGGNPDDFQPAVDPDENVFKELMSTIREKRAERLKALEQAKEENYTKKLQIIDKIKEILDKPDDVNKSYKDFKALQQEWSEIGDVPATKSTDLWRSYQQYVEQFYDTLKLNNEFRAYDFKKNLELKLKLCEAAEKLADDKDPVSAFRKLQLFHQQFREIGPVARDLREQVWERFKTASTVINKRHQEFFEERKNQEQDNLDQKSAICEIIEGFDLDSLKTFADWNKKSEQISQLQAKWKTIGFAPQKYNVKIYERFRTACDAFFSKKSEFFKGVRSNLSENLKIKRQLCEQAEALKDSTDWKNTTETLVQLQKKWKEVGTVSKKFSDELWKRFNSACDEFFDAKKKATSSQFSEQKENLAKKRALVDRLKEIATPDENSEDLRDTLSAIQDEWNQIGHVPFKDKEKVFKAFRAEMDRIYSAIGATATKRRVERFKNELKNGGADKLRDRLTRQYDILKNEIKTYENNLGFLNLSSKSKQGNNLVEELNRKVEKLRADLEEIKLKIKACDQSEDAQEPETVQSVAQEPEANENNNSAES